MNQNKTVFERYQQKNSAGKMQYYWRIRSESNNKIMGDSGEGYSSAAARDTALETILEAVLTKTRDELVKDK